MLRSDGVDLTRFAACVYETLASTGGWLRLDGDGESVRLPLPAAPGTSADGDEARAARRIDVKLFARAASGDCWRTST